MKKLIVSIIIGLFLAGASTHTEYSCPSPIHFLINCVSWEKAVMHPGDLLHNKQGSLVHFSEFFVIASGLSYVILWLLIDKMYHRSKGKKL